MQYYIMYCIMNADRKEWFSSKVGELPVRRHYTRGSYAQSWVATPRLLPAMFEVPS